MNSNATLVLGFVQNSNDVLTLIKLTPTQQAAFSTQAAWTQAGYQDCEPQNLPKYCVGKVGDPSGLFDRPTKAIFSSDGQTVYVLNCGPECGGAKAGIVTIPISSAVLNGNPGGPAGQPPTRTASGAPVPGLTASVAPGRFREGRQMPCRTERRFMSRGSNCNRMVCSRATSALSISRIAQSPARTPSAMERITR